MRFARLAVITGITLGFLGCSLSDLTGSSRVPAGTADPAVVESAEGAVDLYHGAVQSLADALSDYVRVSGLFSDELDPSKFETAIGGASYEIAIDSRYLPGEGQTVIMAGYQGAGNSVFNNLQKTRGNARQARGALREYAPLIEDAVRGHTYAIEGYAEILLADLYCSGVPLSTVEYGGDFTLHPGASTEDIYRNAVRLFDSAIALAQDSAAILNLARIGKARALIGIGDYNGAKATAVDVPVDYKYELTYSVARPNMFRYQDRYNSLSFSVSDGEGLLGNFGIQYATRGDPRVTVVHINSGATGSPPPRRIYEATKYASTGVTPIILASGIEAQLIKAEAELNNSGPWLETLNALRTSCTDTAICPGTPPPGSGGVAGLSPLTSPGAQANREALLFEERAFWLFLTGQRQGDMRRMIRNYGWNQDEVYVSGPYPNQNGAGVYGYWVNMPIPLLEEESNPLFSGCINREA